MTYDFHTHTIHSDGELTPVELARRAIVCGYKALAITDHVAMGSLAQVIQAVSLDCALVNESWPLLAIPGVELTHVPAAAIPRLARQAKELGAKIVVVHGESPVEPVEPGTNRAALSSAHVDILAHPGLISAEEARLAAAQGIFLEITARRGHCLANGHVAALARAMGARLIVDSDAHDEDLLTAEAALVVARGAGLDEAEARQLVTENPHLLLKRIGYE
ncbi:MAG: histidinol phosphate phosphatase domain-containing protein [Chloroflexi bacterium]|nr:histidinol phosphate phosphatase domain-containing protein [Chloroflexota bacterium]